MADNQHPRAEFFFAGSNRYINIDNIAMIYDRGGRNGVELHLLNGQMIYVNVDCDAIRERVAQTTIVSKNPKKPEVAA
jgi:hypothetical protein